MLKISKPVIEGYDLVPLFWLTDHLVMFTDKVLSAIRGKLRSLLVTISVVTDSSCCFRDTLALYRASTQVESFLSHICLKSEK